VARTSAVLEVQRLALNEKMSLATVLRHAWAVAQKLGVDETAQWLQYEFKGYPKTKDSPIPEYRRVSCELKALNPYRGLIPIQFESADEAKAASSIRLRDSIAALETNLNLKDGYEVAYAQPGLTLEFPAYTVVPRSAIRSVLDTVRTTVLEWAVDLQKAGIHGDLLSFTEDEREKSRLASKFFCRVAASSRACASSRASASCRSFNSCRATLSFNSEMAAPVTP
jgi:hypothetical protein